MLSKLFTFILLWAALYVLTLVGRFFRLESKGIELAVLGITFLVAVALYGAYWGFK